MKTKSSPNSFLIGFILATQRKQMAKVVDVDQLVAGNSEMETGVKVYDLLTGLGTNAVKAVVTLDGSGSTGSINIPHTTKRKYKKRKKKGSRAKGSRLYEGKIVPPAEVKRLIKEGKLAPRP